MRNIRIVVILSMTLGFMFPLVSLAADTANTETNTNIQAEATENPIFADAEPISDIFQQQADKNNTNDTQDERLAGILSMWREKQLQQWETLPQQPFLVNASAYTASADECGNSRGITSSGVKVEADRTIACPLQFPFGAKINIEGLGTYVCEDRGGAIKGNRIDIYMRTKEEALAFGRQNLLAHVVM